MELPVALKSQYRGKKKSSSKDVGGRLCFIHFHSTVDENITPLTKDSFCKIKETAAKRLKLSDDIQRLLEICNNIPYELDSTAHGYHRRCYQLFTLLPKASKRKQRSAVVDNELPSTSKMRRRSSAASTASSNVLFPVCFAIRRP